MALRAINHNAEIEPALKKRKIRKGTLSCWECKRRKTRCTFASSDESICDGCRSRKVKCISQEFYPDPDTSRKRADELDRPSSPVKLLSKQDDTSQQDHPLNEPQHKWNTPTHTGQSATRETSSSVLPSDSRMRTGYSVRDQLTGKYDEICDALRGAWPNQSELGLMTDVDVGASTFLHGTVCMSYTKLMSKTIPSPKEILQLPPTGSHPVMVAHKLLMLGSFLQSMPLDAVRSLERQSVNCHQIMSGAVETADRLVTSNDDLTVSLEGIECLMIESMFHNNAGNLRRAWLVNRRAMMIGQMMGLHLNEPCSFDTYEAETRERIDPEYMWARLVITDRYLCLMLGLPQCSQDNPFATPKALASCSPIDRMERLESVIGGQILQRNREDDHNLETTYQIDKLLQEAAALMPAEWWLAPDPVIIAGSDMNAFDETTRLTNQFAHYHLLARLHLPYILQSSTDRRYDYSKIVAVNASREILLRFVSFRGSSTNPAYCRGIDFLAFIASTTLCLAYINAGKQSGASMDKHATALDCLVHQRLGDCGLMKRTLETMKEMVRMNNDAIAHKVAGTLRRLLAVEAVAMNGISCNTSIAPQHDDQGFWDTRSNDSSGVLSITIPHLGTITVDQSSTVKYIKRTHTSDEESHKLHLPLKASMLGPRTCPESEVAFDYVGQQTDERVATSTTNLGSHQVESHFPHFEPHTGPSNADLMRQDVDLRGMVVNKEFFSLDENLLDQGLPEDFDEWALQGVDIALFESMCANLESFT